MQFHKTIRSSVACILSAGTLTLSLNAAPVLAAPADPTTAGPGANLLSNPGHEHPGTYFAGRGELNVTWNWVPFWEEPPEGYDKRDQNFRTPEFRPVFSYQYPYRVHSGGGSDRWFNFYALNKAAGVMQVVNNLPIGKPVRFSTWAELWSSNDTGQGEPPPSSNDGNMQIRVCVQTDGGPRDMVSPNLVCSDWAQPYDKWEQIYVDATPISNTVLVLVQSTASLPVQHNDAYVDDSCLEVLPDAGGQSICLGANYVPSAASTTTTTSATTTATAVPVQAPAGDSPAVAVSAAGVNIRATPSLSGTVIGGARRGDVLTVTGQTADHTWYQVKASSKAGWVYASLVIPNAAAKAVAVTK
jgi:hypothetical protein